MQATQESSPNNNSPPIILGLATGEKNPKGILALKTSSAEAPGLEEIKTPLSKCALGPLKAVPPWRPGPLPSWRSWGVSRSSAGQLWPTVWTRSPSSRNHKEYWVQRFHILAPRTDPLNLPGSSAGKSQSKQQDEATTTPPIRKQAAKVILTSCHLKRHTWSMAMPIRTTKTQLHPPESRLPSPDTKKHTQAPKLKAHHQGTDTEAKGTMIL